MRIKRAVNATKKRRKILRAAKGYWGTKSTNYRVARQAVMKSGNYAYIGRKLQKGFPSVVDCAYQRRGKGEWSVLQHLYARAESCKHHA